MMIHIYSYKILIQLTSILMKASKYGIIVSGVAKIPKKK